MIVPLVPVSQRQIEIDGADLRIAHHGPGRRGDDRRDEEWQRDSISRVRRPGVSVRATIQANSTASDTAMAVLRNAMPSVSSRMRNVGRGKSRLVAVEVEFAGDAGRRRMQAAVKQRRQRIDRQHAQHDEQPG